MTNDFLHIHKSVTDSTNEEAKRLLAAEKISDRCVISADYQTHGRGQQQSKWDGESKQNFLFSIVLDTSFLEAKNQFIISQTIALGMKKYLDSFALAEAVKIKWPNDIYVGLHKIAGILIENTVQGLFLSHTIIGIGLNVNQTQFSNTLPNPTSLALLTGESFDLEHEFPRLLHFLGKELLKLRGSRSMIRRSYIKNMLFVGEVRKYKYLDQMIIGKIKGVNTYGHLQVEIEDMETIECSLKEIAYII